MAGDWRAAPGTDLAEALMPFAARMGRLVPKPLLSLRGLVDRAIPRHQRNTLEGSRSNISAHYDLSNDLFATFLDPSMSYSSALFDPTPAARRAGPARGAAAQGRRRSSTPRTCGPAAGCSRSAPAGASSPSAPPVAARRSPR